MSSGVTPLKKISYLVCLVFALGTLWHMFNPLQDPEPDRASALLTASAGVSPGALEKYLSDFKAAELKAHPAGESVTQLPTEKPNVECPTVICSKEEWLFNAGDFSAVHNLLLQRITIATSLLEPLPIEDWQLFRSTLIAQGNAAAYSAFLEAIPNYYPQKSELLIEHANVLFSSGESGTSEILLKTTLNMYPDKPEVLRAFADRFAVEDRLEEALRYATRLNQIEMTTETEDGLKKIRQKIEAASNHY